MLIHPLVPHRSERMVLPLWRSLHSLNLMLPKEDRKAMLLRLYNEDTPLMDHSKDRFFRNRDRTEATATTTTTTINHDDNDEPADEIKEEEEEDEGADADVQDVEMGATKGGEEGEGDEKGGVADATEGGLVGDVETVENGDLAEEAEREHDDAVSEAVKAKVEDEA